VSHTPSTKTDSPKPSRAAGPQGDIRHGSGRGSARLLRRLRRWALALADSTGIVVGILVAWELGTLPGDNLFWSILIVPVWVFVAKLQNLYDRDDRRIQHRTTEEFPSLLSTAAITVVVAKAISEILPIPVFSSAAVIVIGGVAVMIAFVLRSLVRSLYRAVADPENTIIIGAGPKAALVSKRLKAESAQGIQLSGFVAQSAVDGEGQPVNLDADYFGPIENLDAIAREHGISRVVIADDSLDSRAISSIINVCRHAEVAVTLVPANQEVLGPDTELNRIAEVPMLDFHFSIPPRSTLAIKRALDVTVSGALLALTSPLLLLSAIAIKLDSRGPVLFRQVRIGKDGRRFTMYKLRTMVADAESRLDALIDLDNLGEPAFKILDDPRITGIGGFLRRSSMDEIPQFFNVLKGDMSLVGPRPEEEAVVVLYDERQRQRLKVKPGLTGPMQVAGRGNLNFEERLALERDYLDNLTIAGDISILIRTPKAVIRGDGAF
jgi:exopolysaccharide biosynthesis polyprenyl glycosylphosphotransferase